MALAGAEFTTPAVLNPQFMTSATIFNSTGKGIAFNTTSQDQTLICRFGRKGGLEAKEESWGFITEAWRSGESSKRTTGLES